MRLLMNNETLPQRNLASEEAITYAVQQGIVRDTLRFWCNEKSVILGYSNHVSSEIDLDLCRRNGIQIVRRTSGGGAVYQDLGNLNYSVVLNTSSFEVPRDVLEIYKLFSEAITVGLSTLGVKAQFHPPNALGIGGYKISGMAIHKLRNSCLVHGTLLVNADLATLNQVLRNIKDTATNVSENHPDITISRVQKGIAAGFVEVFHVELYNDGFTEGELRKADELQRLKYENDSWNFRIM
jgi:lipoate-protein ligase A